jgi:hypothetical protein
MSDGKRLENVGVVPDLPALPKGIAFRQNLDPVLAYAASQFGIELSPVDAGKLGFMTTKEENEDEDENDEDG